MNLSCTNKYYGTVLLRVVLNLFLKQIYTFKSALFFSPSISDLPETTMFKILLEFFYRNMPKNSCDSTYPWHRTIHTIIVLINNVSQNLKIPERLVYKCRREQTLLLYYTGSTKNRCRKRLTVWTYNSRQTQIPLNLLRNIYKSYKEALPHFPIDET